MMRPNLLKFVQWVDGVTLIRYRYRRFDLGQVLGDRFVAVWIVMQRSRQ